MTWTATIVSARDNPTPTGFLGVTVRFADGARSFDRDYKVSGSASEIEAFVQTQLNTVEATYEALTALPDLSLEAVPHRVTNFQARAALRQAGLFDAVDAHCKQAGGSAWDAWEYANHFYRTGALVLSLAPAFGLSESALDDLFRAAAQIEA